MCSVPRQDFVRHRSCHTSAYTACVIHCHPPHVSYTVTHRLCHTLSPTACVIHCHPPLVSHTHAHTHTHARLHARTHTRTHTHTHTHPSLSLTSPLGAECRLVQPGIGLCMQCFAPTARQLVGFMRQSTRQSNPNRWSPWLIASAHPGICPPNTRAVPHSVSHR